MKDVLPIGWNHKKVEGYDYFWLARGGLGFAQYQGCTVSLHLNLLVEIDRIARG